MAAPPTSRVWGPSPAAGRAGSAESGCPCCCCCSDCVLLLLVVVALFSSGLVCGCCDVPVESMFVKEEYERREMGEMVFG